MIQPVILAAGKGTRMRSVLPKVLHEVQGKPMLGHVLDVFDGIRGFAKPIVVVGYGADTIRARFGTRADYALQQDISGTASAVKTALPLIYKGVGAALVVYGDQPFLRQETLIKSKNMFERGKYDLIVGVVTVPDFKNKHQPFNAFGRIVRNSQNIIERVVEYKNLKQEEKNILELNAGLCLVRNSWLKHALSLITPNPKTGEFYLTDLVHIAYKEGKLIGSIELSPQEALGINSPEDAEWAATFL